MALTTKLDLEPNGKVVSEKVYRGMIGLLLYLTATRLYIIFSVYLCARLQVTSSYCQKNF